MNRFLKGVGVAAVAFFALIASANAQTYVGARVGTTSGSEIEGISLNDDTVYGAVVGYDFGPHWRVEGAVDRIAADTPPFNIHAMDYSATAFFDIPVSGSTEAYVGAGFDYVDGEVELGPFSASQSGAGWHAAAGLAYEVNDRWTVQAEARHIEADLDGLEVSTNTFTLGARLAL